MMLQSILFAILFPIGKFIFDMFLFQYSLLSLTQWAQIFCAEAWMARGSLTHSLNEDPNVSWYQLLGSSAYPIDQKL